MTENCWYKILSNTSPQRPVSLDDLLPSDRGSKPNGKVLFPEMAMPPSLALWEREAGSPTHIGIRIHEPPECTFKVARLLAAAAIERNVFPVILSRVDYCGFEQFGFRIERIPDEQSAAQAAEEEIRKFWDLAIIIDGHEVDLLS